MLNFHSGDELLVQSENPAQKSVFLKPLCKVTHTYTCLKLYHHTVEITNTAFDNYNISFLYIHSAVLDVLNESLPVISNSIEKELSASQSLAWKYTAVLEKLTDSDHQPEELDVSSVLLKQALYNIRQHEVFLKMLLVR